MFNLFKPKQKTPIDYIIVGQGLAGTTLAHTFIQENKTVLVIDEQKEITSSKVAAGMWNPMVFKRYTQSFLADKMLALNSSFFPTIEKTLYQKFYHPRPYYRVFPNQQDITHWEGKLENPEVKDYLEPKVYTGLDSNFYTVEHGAAPIHHCGFLDVKKYVSTTESYLLKNKSFLAEKFSFDDLKIENETVYYKQFTAKKIIFCEGLEVLNNPYWKDVVEFYPVKGELLTIKADLPEKEAIINKGIFIVPLEDDLYNVGSTYNWSDINYEPTESAKTLLIGKIKEILKVPFEVVKHQAAIRPAAKDRRPFVGFHPQHPHVGILNGLGAKGVMLAPYFANQLVNNELNGSQIHPEADVKRCFGN